MDRPYELTFPMFALLLKDGTGTVFLRHGDEFWLPLFTDAHAAESYREKTRLTELPCQILHDAGEVREFVIKPLSRSPAPEPARKVVIDPLDNVPRVVTLFDLADFLYLLNTYEIES